MASRTDEPQSGRDEARLAEGAICAEIGSGVLIGALCRSLHACLEDVQRLASVQAVAPLTATERTLERALTPSSDFCGPLSDGHDTCSWDETDTQLNASRSSLCGQALPAASLSISS